MSNKWGVKPEQAEILLEIQKMTGKSIPLVDELIWNLPGVVIEKGNIIGLKLYESELTTLPESIGNLKSLQDLELSRNQLTTLPESITNLQSLQKLNLSSNQLTTLPESITNLQSLQKLNLSFNQLTTLPESISNLRSLRELILPSNELTTLPKSIGNFQSLQTLQLWSNELTTLPESITNLQSLQKLNLSLNQLTTLPDSITNLQSLKDLSLGDNKLVTLPEVITKLKSLQRLVIRGNQLTSLPESMWQLNNLIDINLDGNPWEDEWKEIAKRDASAIIDFCRQRASIRIFLSHAVVDYELFRIKGISEYLDRKDEIYKVFYCEEDLAGNIDNFMNEKLSQCQLVLFFASKKSVYNSEDCRHELELARKHNIQIIPIKGPDIEWKELKERNLSRELGYLFEPEDFGTFCQKLYDYIKKLKREIHLFEPEQAKIDRARLNFKTSFNNYIDSEDFKKNFKEIWNNFEELFQDLSNDQISFGEYFSKSAKLIDKK